MVPWVGMRCVIVVSLIILIFFKSSALGCCLLAAVLFCVILAYGVPRKIVSISNYSVCFFRRHVFSCKSHS